MESTTLIDEIRQDLKKPKRRAKPVVEPVKPKGRSWKAKARLIILVLIITVIGVAYAAEKYVDWRAEHEWQIPVAWVGVSRKIQATKPVQAEEKKKPVVIVEELKEPKQKWHGEASYYSFDGCVGCNAQRIMANGEVLDDMRKTLAFNKLPMNTEVVVTNLSNGVKTTAVVTDTGGFESLGRIADLSLATKKAIGCNDICQVRIELF